MSAIEVAESDEQLRVERWPMVHVNIRIVGATVQQAEAVVHHCPSFSRPARSSSRQIVWACVQYAATVQYHCVTLSDLSDSAGVSERRVRRAFSECLDISPTAYLRTAALVEVRRALLEPTTVRNAVTRAATEFGFWHLSRFASQYRAAFGESPSETVARARAAA